MEFKIKNLLDRYVSFQSRCHSPFHVVQAIKEACQERADVFFLDVKAPWVLEPGKAYGVIHPDQKSLIAFHISKKPVQNNGFCMIGAHTDSPALKLRLHPWDCVEGTGASRLLTQKHGSLIYRSWLDRPLILGGAVYRKGRGYESNIEIRETQYPIAVIPDLAIHLDRDKNAQNEINPEIALHGIFGTSGQNNLKASFEDLKEKLGEHLGISLSHLDGFELYLAPYWPHVVVGADQSMILGPRHDDLAMVFCSTEAFLDTLQEKDKTSVLCLCDGEETGSLVTGGAKSLFFRDVLSRVCASLNSDLHRALMNSFFISADMAHGIHPAFIQKHDLHHRPRLNEGLVIKENANDSYATSGYSSGVFRRICAEAKVPVQGFVCKQDQPCGSTIGPIMAAQLGCPVVDIGAPMWGMHSSAETMGVLDLDHGVRAFSQAFLM